jgi:hypothetical protein
MHFAGFARTTRLFHKNLITFTEKTSVRKMRFGKCLKKLIFYVPMLSLNLYLLLATTNISRHLE